MVTSRWSPGHGFGVVKVIVSFTVSPGWTTAGSTVIVGFTAMGPGVQGAAASLTAARRPAPAEVAVGAAVDGTTAAWVLVGADEPDTPVDGESPDDEEVLVVAALEEVDVEGLEAVLAAEAASEVLLGLVVLRIVFVLVALKRRWLLVLESRDAASEPPLAELHAAPEVPAATAPWVLPTPTARTAPVARTAPHPATLRVIPLD